MDRFSLEAEEMAVIESDVRQRQTNKKTQMERDRGIKRQISLATGIASYRFKL